MAHDEFEEIGTVGVDCGMVWIGDAGEVVHSADLTKGERKGDSRVAAIEGGVALTAGYGDGTYPVLVRRLPNGRIAEVRIVFIEDGDAA